MSCTNHKDPTWCYILRLCVLKPHVEGWIRSKRLAHEKCVADNLGAVTLENVTVSDPNGMKQSSVFMALLLMVTDSSLLRSD